LNTLLVKLDTQNRKSLNTLLVKLIHLGAGGYSASVPYEMPNLLNIGAKLFLER
jgi:hypothetical protein